MSDTIALQFRIKQQGDFVLSGNCDTIRLRKNMYITLFWKYEGSVTTKDMQTPPPPQK